MAIIEATVTVLKDNQPVFKINLRGDDVNGSDNKAVIDSMLDNWYDNIDPSIPTWILDSVEQLIHNNLLEFEANGKSFKWNDGAIMFKGLVVTVMYTVQK